MTTGISLTVWENRTAKTDRPPGSNTQHCWTEHRAYIELMQYNKQYNKQ